MTATTPDPAALMRSRGYVVLLLLAAIIGVPISVVAYGFLTLVTKLQQWVFTDLPKSLGFHGMPLWWPVPFLALAGLAVVVAYLTSAWLMPAPTPAPAQPNEAGAQPVQAGPSPAGPPAAASVPAAGVPARQDRADKPQDREDEADQA